VIGTEELTLVRGWDDTRATLRRWRARPLAMLGPWVLGSLAIAAVLLTATWLVATVSTPDPSVWAPTGHSPWGDYGFILYRNGLVLALHAMACVAGFIAGSSLPIVATGERGFACQASVLVPRRSPSATLRWRRVHHQPRRLAMGFVAVATLFSLCTQAYALGLQASSIADARDTSPALLMVSLLPHALPELCALFLPLAAWLLAARRRARDELLAATFATTAVAVPVLLAAAAVEVWVSPHVLSFLK
jgi:hypothetical protein